MCFSQWRNKDKLSRIKNGKLQYLNQHNAQIDFNDTTKKEILNTTLIKNLSEAQNGIIKLPRSTLLIGDKLYNNVWHPADELEKSFTTMEHQPFIIDHKDGVEDEIGWMENAEYDPDTKKLTAIPILNLNTAKGVSALNHIRNRLMAEKAPETSVGFWASEHVEQIPLLENAEHVSARDWEFDHNSLVTRGAGSPDMGIGIGLSLTKPLIPEIKFTLNKKESETMDEKPIEQPKSEPEKFTMTKEEFRAMMKEELAQKEAAIKQENKDAEKSAETDAMKKKIADLEKQLATRTTATRDGQVTNNGMGAPLTEKQKMIRKQLIGKAIIECTKAGEEVHIRLEDDQQLPPAAVM